MRKHLEHCAVTDRRNESRPSGVRTGFAIAAPLLLLAACAGIDDGGATGSITWRDQPVPAQARLASYIPGDKINTPARQRAADAIAALDQGDLVAASAYVNQALKMDIRNSYLQFLNGYIYHRRALAGDAESFPLAEEGYRLAIDFERSNWMAHFYLGQYYMDLRQYGRARDAFANAALFQPDNQDVLYQLAKASYFAGDPAVSAEAFDRITELNGGMVADPRFLQGMAIVDAAANRPDQANMYLASLESGPAPKTLVDTMERRVGEWARFHRSVAAGGQDILLAQNEMPPPPDGMNQMVDPGAAPTVLIQPSPSPAYQDPYAAPAASDAVNPFEPGPDPLARFTETEMVAVDVVIISTEEDINNSAGVNLLSGLAIQFGDSRGGPAFSYAYENTKDYLSEFGSSKSRTITRALGIPSISYSLNIANANRTENQVLAKPTLVALGGETSQFFSGVDVSAAAVSGAAGDSVSVDKEIGVKLEVTPEILPNDMVKLKIFAERTFLTQPSQSVVFQFRLDTTKTSVNATVALKFGETLILSGLTERELENNRDGVPGLQDVPLVQYAFSRRAKRSFDKSVLILLTPRRPQFTDGSSRGGESGNTSGSPQDGVERLAARDGDWFQPDPTIRDIFRKLKTNVLYEEFRQGDFAVEDWQSRPENQDRLKAALDWLYF